MDDIDPQLAAVITTYHAFVQRAVATLRQAFPDAYFLVGTTHTIPRTGVIDGMAFFFHGIGCTMEIDGYVVSWDFGPRERLDGFEAWKLWLFTRDHPAEFGVYADLAVLRSAITHLIDQGQVATMHDFGFVGNMVFLK